MSPPMRTAETVPLRAPPGSAPPPSVRVVPLIASTVRVPVTPGSETTVPTTNPARAQLAGPVTVLAVLVKEPVIRSRSLALTVLTTLLAIGRAGTSSSSAVPSP